MLGEQEHLDQSIGTLLENSLVYSQNETIKVLAPVREYINGIGMNIQRGIAQLESFHVCWLKQLSGTTQEKQEQIQPHILNITKILNEQASSVSKTFDVKALDILTTFTKFYPLTLDILNNILNKSPELDETYKVELRFERLYMLTWLAMWQEAETEARGMEYSMKNDPKSHARVMKDLGEIYRLQNKFTEAAEMLTRAKNQFEEIGGQLEAAHCIQILAIIHQMQNKYTEATEMLTTAKYQLEQIGDQLGAAHCLRSLEQIYQMQSKYTEAAEMLTTAKDQFDQLGDQLGATQCLRSLGDIYLDQKKHIEAAEMLTLAKDQFEQIQSYLGVAECLRSLGRIHSVQANYTQAVALLSMAKDQFEKIENPLGVADCMYHLGVSYRIQGLYEDAKSAIADAAFKFQSLENPRMHYGGIFTDQHLYSEARREFEKAADIFASLGELQNEVEMCNNKLAYLDQLEQT
ncbi:hypothetical protein D9758_005488 [Tetrapyrgos nigripes]|uniref:TPR-like protein n=1 Tax=Tetrapyrgos nigripes TaxID=182062 RepID=A0A8H5GI68_9AGAR|nr:hypothetical protein D9758_005488 [Tetrapyrgos nigripes]